MEGDSGPGWVAGSVRNGVASSLVGRDRKPGMRTSGDKWFSTLAHTESLGSLKSTHASPLKSQKVKYPCSGPTLASLNQNPWGVGLFTGAPVLFKSSPMILISG